MRFAHKLSFAATGVSLLALFATPVVVAQTPAPQMPDNPPPQHDTTQPKHHDRAQAKSPAAKPAVKAHSDAEIMAMLIALDENEIGAANIAMKQNLDPKVLDLAKKIEQDHTENKDQTTQLADKIGVKPKTTPAVHEMKSEGQRKVTWLDENQGPTFANTFVTEMVKGHRDALTMLDGFMATAKNPELKTHLTDTRQHVQMHLEQAEQLQTNTSENQGVPGTR